MIFNAAQARGRVWLAVLWMGLMTTASFGYDDLQGNEWRWLHETQGLSWAQVAALCPQDGATPCVGAINGRDLTGWVWGTPAQVRALMAQFATADAPIPQDPPFSVGGYQYVDPATRFQNSLGVTAHFQGCPTYQPVSTTFFPAVGPRHLTDRAFPAAPTPARTCGRCLVPREAFP